MSRLFSKTQFQIIYDVADKLPARRRAMFYDRLSAGFREMDLRKYTDAQVARMVQTVARALRKRR